jgi:predicted lipoprotein with Yx(FWY)xxD motif
LLSAGALALAACGSGTPGAAASAGGTNATLTSALHYLKGTATQNNAPKNTGDFFAGARQQSPAATKWVQLSAGKAGDLDPVVIDGAGFTLYRFDKDTTNPPASHCDGTCADTWPPVQVTSGSKVFLDGIAKSAIGVIKRDDGSLQLTIDNSPIYRFSGDTNPGQTNGEGVGGTWFGVTPTGGKALPPGGLPATGSSSSTGSNSTGSNSSSGGAQPSGNTSVTLFDDPNFADNGSQQLSGSTGCQNVFRPNVASSLQLSGAPIKIWTGPNCTGTSQVLTTGVANLANIGFDNDIQSIRFGVSASSGTAGGSTTTTTTDNAQPTSTSAAGDGGVTLGNGSVILDTGTNFSEPNGSFGAAGPGCQNVPGGSLVQSLQLSGGPIKLWSAANCTGQSTVVTSDVADLSTIGFSGKLASIRFGDN